MNIFFSRDAHKQLLKLPGRTHDLIVEKLTYLANDFGGGNQNLDIRKLSGREAYRLRVGNYRVIYIIDAKQKEMVVLVVAHRKEVYRFKR